MTDTQPGKNLCGEALQRGADVARKVSESDGPLQFDASEAESLRVILMGLRRDSARSARDELRHRRGSIPEASSDRPP